MKLHIERAAVKVEGKPVELKAPKDNETRAVYLPQVCLDLITALKKEKEQEQRKLGTAWIENDWLFTQWNGEMMNVQTPTKWFSKFLARNGLPHKKFHSLRHTSATLLLYGGANVKQVQQRLGHSDIETTNKYLHFIEEADRHSSDLLDNFLRG
jgi:integrase